MNVWQSFFCVIGLGEYCVSYREKSPSGEDAQFAEK